MARGFGPVLRIRNFMLLVSSGSMSQLGDRLTHMLLITLIALASPGRLLAYSTGSLAFVLPTLVLAPIAGVLVDRWDKRRVLGFTHFIQSGLLFATPVAIAASHSFVPFWIALFLFFGLDVFNNTAHPALMPALAARRKLLLANSVSSTFGRVATVIGMVAGGFLIKWVGWRWGLALNACTHLTAGILALSIHKHRAPPVTARQPLPAGNLPALVRIAFVTLFRDLAAVVRLVLVNRLVAFTLASVVVSTGVSAVAYTLLIFIIQQTLGLGTGGVGIFSGILAVGMIAGAAVLGLIRRRINRPALVAGIILLYGLLFLVGSRFITVWFLGLVALAAGVAFSWLNIVQSTLLQEEALAGIRGRIFSTREFIVNGTFLLSTVAVGAVADLASCRVALVVTGATLALLGLCGFWLARTLPKQAD